MNMRLENKTAVVTGAGQGIGKGIALALAREGANVVISDINIKEATKVVREIEELGRKSLAVKTDVTSKKEVDDLIKKTIEKFGSLDIMVSNAGVSSMEYVIDMPEEKWDFNMDVNLKGTFLVTQAAAQQMIKQQNGKIICTASMAGKGGVATQAHYNASKHGVIAYVKSLAQELAPSGITVNSICPGSIKTSMQDREVQWGAEIRGAGATPEDLREEMANFTPLGRIGLPEDVAKVVVFFASDESAFMTGQAINVTGGQVNTM
jgi:meso-butanediol dehydrogenase / (S,S)-butanediol dehydrogenase / diacetyl reductase